jgi:hypothetical protein
MAAEAAPVAVPPGKVYGLVEKRAGAERVPVPIKGVEVTASVVDFLAHVRLRQQYVNQEARAVEAVYIFPLDVHGAWARVVPVGRARGARVAAGRPDLSWGVRAASVQPP